jgi:carbamoyl-phosphate synthase large subunit
MRVLIEASGGVASGFMIHALQQAGHEVIASDINGENAGSLLADDYIQMPLASDGTLWSFVIDALGQKRVDAVIPSLDDMLLGWDAHRVQLEAMGIVLVLSPKETLVVCLDKWLTYQFFIQHDIPTPKTSLMPEYALFKPRQGRGAKGIIYAPNKADRPIDMFGLLSQQYLEGEEYTIDILCDNAGDPVYIVPRCRQLVINGKAINAQIIYDEAMIEWVKLICRKLHFVGAINIQCFKLADGRILFTEINPRLASGMALSFAASGNWLVMMIDHQLDQKPIAQQPIQWGMKMYRQYCEVFSV